ncbi:hypothetical protein [Microbacterium sp. SLBN-146]|uniref:hypothetical protein n=1 Tax=Microbacterium sp. SLBN-146 TaxID=2768457 RepID=UPI00116AE822|nr:hypothetical protein [Microbacterium sp. SLBN-146]TQJ31323.1 hypothetical protein FBY39_1787 [Microbacterium sp. SLBN-146]
MKRTIAAFALAGLALGLAGCTTGFGEGPDIFDREQTAEDTLPAEAEVGELDASSTRYVGVDSADNEYWVGRPTGTRDTCIVLVAPDPAASASACGGGMPSLTNPAGVTVEWASSPNRLSPDDAELIGDTLLVAVPAG